MKRALIGFRLNPLAAALALYLFLPVHANGSDCDPDSPANVCTISTTSTQVNGGFTTPLANGDSLIITSTGSITTPGIAVDGFENPENPRSDLTVEVYGTVGTTGSFGHAIDLGESTNARLIVGGSVTTAGNTAYGVSLEKSKNANVLVDGTIQTTGTGRSDALRLANSTGATVVINGTVSSTGPNNGVGIQAIGVDNISITVGADGKIETSGGSALGLRANDSATVTVNGTIKTTGDHAWAIQLADSATVMLDGSVETTGKSARGLRAIDSATVTVNGTIKTSGFDAPAILLRDSATVLLDGSVETAGGQAVGLGADNFATVTVNGTIKTSGVAASAIRLGDSATVMLNGSVETSGGSAVGLRADNFATVTVNGTIKTTGDNAWAIQLADSATVMLDGSVETTGKSALGLRAIDSATVTVNGTIKTSGFAASAIRLGDSATVMLDGSVETAGGQAVGLRADNFATVTVNGTVKTTGDDAWAIQLGDTATVKINGQVDTAGNAAHGLVIYNASVVQVNGSINTKGIEAHGIRVNGDNNVIEIVGSVKATGSGAKAIANESGTNNLYTLREGAVIVGDIATESSGNTLRFDFGASKSYVFETTGDWILEDISGRAVVKGSAMAAGVGRAETADEMLFERTQLFLQSMDRGQMRRDLAGDSALWVDPYAYDSKRSASSSDPTVMKYGSNGFGLTLGYDFKAFGLKAQAIGNIQSGRLNIDDNTQDVDSTSWLVGLRLPSFYEAGPVSFSAMAFAGRNQYSSDSQVLTNTTSTGTDVYSSSYGSTQLLFGLGAKYTTPITQSTNLSVKADLYLSQEYIEGYQEGPYFSWNSRTLTQGSAFLEAGIDHRLTDQWLVQAKVGANTQTLFSGKNTNYTINNTQVTFSGGQTNDTGLYAMLGTQYQVKDNAQVGISVWYGQSSNSVKTIQGMVEAKFLF